ncbi:WhiB family transcriptional regulator [Streptomyces sp. NPDC029554]|uniref:WhiB family transcriptional regulator n=1 Tax=Streptomyces sp. NPDC029554 TaxID=3155126 RepID=UPI0033DCCF14
MSNYTGAVPETKRKPDWRTQAACRADSVKPDEMFPDNNEHGIAHAKAICASCPVAMACLQHALRTGDNEHGIRGGLKPAERRAVAKIVRDRHRSEQAVTVAVQQVLYPATARRSLREVWEEHTYPMPDGHLGWNGSLTFSWRGHSYAPKRTSFALDRGHDPKGIVRRTCPVVECVHPLHLEDNAERKQRVAAKQQKAA